MAGTSSAAVGATAMLTLGDLSESVSRFQLRSVCSK